MNKKNKGTQPKTKEEILEGIKYKEKPKKELIKKTKISKPKNYKIVEETDIIKTGIKANIEKFMNPEDRILINMEMDSGDHRLFYVPIKGETFKYKGRSYCFDNNLKYYISTLKTYCLDYNQSLSIPFRKTIDVAKCKEGINALDDSLSTSLNPIVLTNALESKVVKDVVAGSSFEEALKLFKILLIVGVVVGVLHFILFVKASGILDNINLPI